MVFVETHIPAKKPLTDSKGQRVWLKRLAATRSSTEMEVISRALALAEELHRDDQRHTGEPYIHHVIAVADILANLKLDHEAIAAGLLHDILLHHEEARPRIEEACGPVVAHLVDGVTRMRHIGDYQSPMPLSEGRAETLRKMLLAMAEDIRVVLIKLADRLHNMRTLKGMPVEHQRKVSRETMEIFAPLANRLGIWHIKWEMEDLAFRHLEPETYKEIARSLKERRVERQQYIDAVVERIQQELAAAGIEATVKGRPKHIYSIWKKMQRKRLGFHELYDVRAVRILVDSIADCYHALGIVHGLWRHIAREFDDYVATPKENNYQSIHTAVIGPEGKVFEIQIRTNEMDKHAELGVAAHWRYKEGGKGNSDLEAKVAWLRRLLDSEESEEEGEGDILDRFKSEIFQDRVYVFTPRGEVLDLPLGATALDFAYAIHSEVGNHCRGAKVDGRMVPLGYELVSGEQVEILTNKSITPSRDWLNPQLGYLHTARARAKVRSWFKAQDHDRNRQDGRSILERELRHLGLDETLIARLREHYHYQTDDELLIAIGRADLNAQQIASALQQFTQTDEADSEESLPTTTRKEPRQPAGGRDDVHISGVGNLLTRMAGCCKPAPGDPIIGYITHGQGVTVHRLGCAQLESLEGDEIKRLIDLEWSTSTPSTYPVDILIEAIDRTGLLRDISTMLANEKINVIGSSTRSDTSRHVAYMTITVEVDTTDHLSRLLNRINQIPNVVDVRRKR